MDTCTKANSNNEQLSEMDGEEQQQEQHSSITESQEEPEPTENASNEDDAGQPSQNVTQVPALLRPRSYYEVLPGTLGANHPGICAKESESIQPRFTKTSPECNLWLQSNEIISEMLSMISQVCYREATRHEMPRIVSCLHRVNCHIYRVRTDTGLAYPPGATGALAVTRKEHQRMPPNKFSIWPPPLSKLRDVWNADDFEAEEDEDALVERLERAAMQLYSHNGDGDEERGGVEATVDDGQQSASADEGVYSCDSGDITALLGEIDGADSEGEDFDDGDSDNEDEDSPSKSNTTKNKNVQARSFSPERKALEDAMARLAMDTMDAENILL
ncbi:hypothetical protein IWX49DRAFT_592006 [Phyllosticta citricarpa]|uniref:Uncharacterized protein n=2 Tax=Phyllosticta TaxID=121621 RepID=A0ABR1M6I1_9PEZI